MRIKDFVEKVLKENGQARNDDFLLVMNVYVKMGFARKFPLGIMIKYQGIESAPSFETITRIRRQIQNEENRFIADEETRSKRIQAEIDYRDRYEFNEKIKTGMIKNSQLNW